jgi:hypothetical protein
MRTFLIAALLIVPSCASAAPAPVPAPVTQPKATTAPSANGVDERPWGTIHGGVLMLDRRPTTEKAAFLGVSVANVSPELREQLKLQRGVGLVVNHVEAGSPAEAAGVKRFDVLQRLDDQILVEPRQLSVLIRLRKAGDDVKLTLVRQAQPVTVTAKLAEKDLPSLEDSRVPGTPGWKTLTIPGRKGGDPFAAGPLTAIKPGQYGIEWSDGELNIDFLQDHGRRIVARNKAGDVIFEGAIDTPEELQKIPEILKAKAMKVIRLTTQPTTFDADPGPTTKPASPLEYRSTLKPFKIAPPRTADTPETM